MTSKVRKGIRRTIAALAAIASLMSVSACSGGSNTAADGTVVSIFNGTTGTFNENFNPFSPTALGPTLGVGSTRPCTGITSLRMRIRPRCLPQATSGTKTAPS